MAACENIRVRFSLAMCRVATCGIATREVAVRPQRKVESPWPNSEMKNCARANCRKCNLGGALLDVTRTGAVNSPQYDTRRLQLLAEATCCVQSKDGITRAFATRMYALAYNSTVERDVPGWGKMRAAQTHVTIGVYVLRTDLAPPSIATRRAENYWWIDTSIADLDAGRYDYANSNGLRLGAEALFRIAYDPTLTREQLFMGLLPMEGMWNQL